MENKFKEEKIIGTNEYVMKNRYLTRGIALFSVFIVLIFASLYIYDKFIVNHSCFTFYLEVKDKEQQKRILTDEEVRECINKICIEYNTGYTMWSGIGGYIGDDNKVHTNDTYILKINNLNPKLASDMANSLIKSVNSTACMVEENRSKAYLVAIN